MQALCTILCNCPMSARQSEITSVRCFLPPPTSRYFIFLFYLSLLSRPPRKIAGESESTRDDKWNGRKKKKKKEEKRLCLAEYFAEHFTQVLTQLLALHFDRSLASNVNGETYLKQERKKYFNHFAIARQSFAANLPFNLEFIKWDIRTFFANAQWR